MVPGVVVIVIGVRAADEGAVEGLRVGIRAVLLVVAAGGRDGAWAGAGPVVGPERGIDPEANQVAPATVTEDVSDLGLDKVIALGCLIAHVGKLETEFLKFRFIDRDIKVI